MADDVVDFLLGAAGAPAKFPEVGTVVRGKVLHHEKRQARDMDNNLKFWEDGNPIFEVVVTLQTEDRDPTLEDDDGIRRLFVRGQMLKAVRDALVKASWRDSLVGGDLAVKYKGDGVPSRNGFSPPKLYVAQFEAPAVADDFTDGAAETNGSIDAYSDEPF